MKTLIIATLMALTPTTLVQAEAVPGKPAPAFEVKDANGKTRTLADAKGKWLVLEWTNKDCPFVKKHYESNNMQTLQKTYTGKDVMWLSVNSTSTKSDEFQTPAETLKTIAEQKSAATAVLIDETGVMGKAYGAKTTPHMFVINPEGVVVYAGAIDDNSSSSPTVIAKSKNFVAAALDANLPGGNKKVAVAFHKPYGCSVKY